MLGEYYLLAFTGTGLLLMGITREMVDFYRRFGVVKVPGIISTAEAAEARRLAVELLETNDSGQLIFEQRGQVSREHEVLRRLTMHPNIAETAKSLAGISLRLLNDDIIAKRPHNETPTAAHRDLPYWPLSEASHSLTAWIALQDTPLEMGGMTFVLGSHRLAEDQVGNIWDEDAWISAAPESVWLPRLAIPLQSGDCTFHHSLTLHMASANSTDDWRIAHRVTLVDAGAVYNARSHNNVVDLGLKPGDLLPDEEYPVIVV